MSSQNTVKSATLTYGTAGTATSVASIGTSTSNPYAMPRQDYTVQVTAFTTGTSGVGATVIFQGSNDNNAWIAVSSATATATQASTSTTYSAGAAQTSGVRYALGRAVVGVTGTGGASVVLGS